MTFKELLAFATTWLAERSIEDPRLEAEVMVREASGLSRPSLYAHAEDIVARPVWEKVEAFLRRRGNREPLAYIIGHREFYGLDFKVDARVLIPRPETEMLVDAGIAACRRLLAFRSPVAIADVGTGSGAIAISVAVNVPQAIVAAVDISPDALDVARDNCERHGVADRVTLLCGDLLSPIAGRVDVILANLPYIKDVDLTALPPEIRQFEPLGALRAGEAGLDLICRLLKQAGWKLSADGTIALEIAWDQGRSVASLARQAFPKVRIAILQDLAGLDRVVEIELSQTEDDG